MHHPCARRLKHLWLAKCVINNTYYTSFRAIWENIARVRGCIFTSPKDELLLVVAMRMVATAHVYYNVQYGRILHSCSMENLYYAHLEYRIISYI